MALSTSPPASPTQSKGTSRPLPPPLRQTSPPPHGQTILASPRRLSGQGALSPGTPSSKSRARDLLRKHYGLGVGPPPPSGKPMDPMDLDSPAFDAKAYYEQLITTSSLTTLLKKENEILTEIRQLESERQSLVYNHHHELIAATDTISAMKTRAESLDADLDLLKVAFSEISRLSAEVAIEDSTGQPEPSQT